MEDIFSFINTYKHKPIVDALLKSVYYNIQFDITNSKKKKKYCL